MGFSGLNKNDFKMVFINLDLLDLFEMSCCYLQNDLREKLESQLQELLSVERIFQLYSVAAKHSVSSLERKCFSLCVSYIIAWTSGFL